MLGSLVDFILPKKIKIKNKKNTCMRDCPIVKHQACMPKTHMLTVYNLLKNFDDKGHILVWHKNLSMYHAYKLINTYNKEYSFIYELGKEYAGKKKILGNSLNKI